ncbi:MAG: peptide chain release factor 2 [Acidobacteriota bacterium]|nr:peptide chain release factor 2 [Acidobacteriota bacterium]
MNDDTLEKIDELRDRLTLVRSYLDLASARRALDEIEREMSVPGFWDRQEQAQEVGRKRARVEKRIASGESIESKAEELDVLLELRREGESVDAEIETLLTQLEADINGIELTMKLSGEHDLRDCIMNIHAGAGGTESQDWAEMLLRMYLRYSEKKGWSTDLLEVSAGEEAGIKSATIMIRGEYAYGYLKAENGVHRLVRISPFDAAKRRHTSFASVFVIPDIDDTIHIEINDKDLRVDTYRSSGAGGQHVNVTDSAIRITHIPTNTVVTCQNERSQHKNRDTAMKLLRARLYNLELEKRKEEQAKVEGEKKEIGFGSQIRSYVLQPYQLVKDLRTGHETGDPSRVLDGDLDGFIEAYLSAQARTSAD